MARIIEDEFGPTKEDKIVLKVVQSDSLARVIDSVASLFWVIYATLILLGLSKSGIVKIIMESHYYIATYIHTSREATRNTTSG